MSTTIKSLLVATAMTVAAAGAFAADAAKAPEAAASGAMHKKTHKEGKMHEKAGHKKHDAAAPAAAAASK